MFTALPIMRWWKFAFNNYLFVYIIISFFHCTIFTILFNCVAFLRLLTIFIFRVHFNFFSNNKQRSIFLSFKYFFFLFFHRSYISSELFLCDFQLRNLATSKPFPVSATFQLLLFLHFTSFHSLLLVNNAALLSLQIIRAPVEIELKLHHIKFRLDSEKLLML